MENTKNSIITVKLLDDDNKETENTVDVDVTEIRKIHAFVGDLRKATLFMSNEDEYRITLNELDRVDAKGKEVGIDIDAILSMTFYTRMW